MKQFNLLFVLALLLAGSGVSAQRYLTEVFSDVTVTANQTYGVNATVLLLGQLGQAVPQALSVDIYEPAGDTETNRPLIVLLHTGNFLPPQVNGGCSGTPRDADIVNLATRLAKMGYVVGAATYRLGWNPVDPSQTTRVFTLINAAYRGVQDSRTCIRYFRRTVAEQNNPYGIDPEKVVLWGVGTGGYVSFASATLDNITDTYIPKFVTPAGPMVIEPINGDLDGTSVGVVPPGYPGFPAGDTLCYPNHVGFSSEFNMGVNMGGALGDTSWIDAGDVPFLSFHVPTDPFAPCDIGIVLVPPPVNLPVVEVMGSCSAQQFFSDLGNNQCFYDANLTDPLSMLARSRNGNIEGFLPFPSTDPTEGGQWSYASSAEPYGVAGSNCDTDMARANLYLDSIVAYFAPRAFHCLNLMVNTEDLTDAVSIGLKVAPNPASSSVFVETSPEFPVDAYQLFDLNGRIVAQQMGVNNHQLWIQRNNLPAGMYVLKLRVGNQVAAQRLLFQ